MTRRISLRLRLTAIILLPLLTIAILAGLWQLGNARRTADDVFDRSLLSAALAVANDVAISGGDALSPRTSDILASTSGGPVFYHVYAPDGVIVAGYATPPVGIPPLASEVTEPAYFEASYLGRTVSGVRLQTQTEIEGFSGLFTTTVWQDSALRAAFVRDLTMRSFIAISSLILSLALIVWFGVRFGLRPLVELEQAIAQRSSADLSPIQRAVPEEVAGVVATLNRLFGQVSTTMSAQSAFIANAAHQLRNPIAGVMALAEAVVSAPDTTRAKKRAEDLLLAAEEAAELSKKLLLLERAEALTQASAFEKIDLSEAIHEWAVADARIVERGVTLTVKAPEASTPMQADRVMLREAISNVLDNALRHGGMALTKITVEVTQDAEDLYLTIEDNGAGIPEADLKRATTRFVQSPDTGSTGLGLSIVEAIVEGHGGTLNLEKPPQGLRVIMRFPHSYSLSDQKNSLGV